MIQLNYNIKNKIKQPAKCCSYCGKSYIKQNNLNKHTGICELIYNAKRKSYDINEEDELPSQQQLFSLLKELTYKYNKLEEKVKELTKNIPKKKIKINFIEKLNSDNIPKIIFQNLIHEITMNEDDVLFLLQNSVFDTFEKIFSNTLFNLNEKYPIYAFVERKNVLYIYQSEKNWVEISNDILIEFLSKVQMKLLNRLHDWKKNTKEKSDKIEILFNKTIVKLLNVEFNKESILNKMNNLIYNKIKLSNNEE